MSLDKYDGDIETAKNDAAQTVAHEESTPKDKDAGGRTAEGDGEVDGLGRWIPGLAAWSSAGGRTAEHDDEVEDHARCISALERVPQASVDMTTSAMMAPVSEEPSGHESLPQASAAARSSSRDSKEVDDMRAWLQQHDGDWSGRKLVQNMLPAADTIFALITEFNRNRGHVQKRLDEEQCDPEALTRMLRALHKDWELIENSFELEDEEPAFDLF